MNAQGDPRSDGNPRGLADIGILKSLLPREIESLAMDATTIGSTRDLTSSPH